METGKFRNKTLYWHVDDDPKGYGLGIWTYCNRCERAYSIEQYCALSGLTLKEFLKHDFNIVEAVPNEVQKMEWPKHFIPLFSNEAKEGREYLKSRSIDIDDNIFYDSWKKAIVFPYYYDKVFCGAQTRYLKPYLDGEGALRKIDTIPGTRLGLLFYGWDQKNLGPQTKGIIVTEGAFNTISIQQALNMVYGNPLKNPWKAIACSGSGVSKHQLEVLKDLKDQGYKIIGAPDSDEAGLKMLEKMIVAKCVTNFVLTNDDEKDWNDLAKDMGKADFAKWFLGNIKKV